ncbi:MAG TPA: hypothetical protein VIY48_07340 [Candidatus Paceibacterota bacterium]
MVLELNMAKARELVELAIEEKGPKYVYVNSYERTSGVCSYVHDIHGVDPEPGCIVGHALILGGLDVEDFTDINEVSATAALDALWDRGLVHTSGAVCFYLDTLQMNQDAGIAWGEANEKALEGYVWDTDNNPKGQWVKRGEL